MERTKILPLSQNHTYPPTTHTHPEVHSWCWIRGDPQPAYREMSQNKFCLPGGPSGNSTPIPTPTPSSTGFFQFGGQEVWAKDRRCSGRTCAQLNFLRAASTGKAG